MAEPVLPNALPVAPPPGAPAALQLPDIVAVRPGDTLAPQADDTDSPAWPPHSLGRLETLALRLAAIGDHTEESSQASPQIVVFAADHGIVDEGIGPATPSTSLERVQALLSGSAPVCALAKSQGFGLSVVDAGLASNISLDTAPRPHPLLRRKIGFGTRNMVLGPAMSVAQTVSALHAGMDVVRHLPGRVLVLGHEGVAGEACAILLLSRLCGVPLADACGLEPDEDDVRHRLRLERLFAVAARHRKAITPFDALAAMGGFEIAMLAGAMLQAASERRVVLVDGFVADAAALVARGLVPAVADYLFHAHRSAHPGHRLLLIHLQSQPLLDLELRTGQGVGALLAWPQLQAAAGLLPASPASEA